MEKTQNKIKTWEKIFIVFMILLIIVFIIIGIRFCIISNINKKHQESKNSSNYYWHSETSSLIVEYWKKDNIRKICLRKRNSNESMVVWKDMLSDKTYLMSESNKIYTMNYKGDIVETFPTTTILTADTNINKFVAAILPTISIKSKKVNGKDCYIVRHSKTGAIIEKETGVVIYSEENELSNREVQYSFGTVTDEDVKEPDLTGYTIKKE